jgi:protein-serine/threonine kinase
LFGNISDLKPENLLLDATGKILKISDFGVSAVFRTQFEKESHKLHGVYGSTPYIAPEEWLDGAEYFPTKVDVWASGMIFYVMLTRTLTWNIAKEEDKNYEKYILRREYGFPPFELLSIQPKRIIYLLLHPEPAKRPEMKQILQDSWVASIPNPIA